jgi:hypothetical protein
MYPQQRISMHPPRMLWSGPLCRSRANRHNGLCPNLSTQDPVYELRRIPIPRAPRVNKGKREARSSQGPRAQRVLSWRGASGGSTMNMQTAGGNGDEDEQANVWRRSSRSCWAPSP